MANGSNGSIPGVDVRLQLLLLFLDTWHPTTRKTVASGGSDEAIVKALLDDDGHAIVIRIVKGGGAEVSKLAQYCLTLPGWNFAQQKILEKAATA